MSYRKHRHRMRTKRASTAKRIRNTRNRRTGGAGLFPEPRTQIQLFTEKEETGILNKMIDFLNGQPEILEELALPGNVKRYLEQNDSELTANIFKYKINADGDMDENEVLTKKEMKSYIFPLLIQLEEIFLEYAHNMPGDDEAKESVKEYHNFTMGLVRSVSNIINPMWFDAIESYLSFINFDKIPGVSAAKQQMSSLGKTISAAMGNKGNDQGVTYNTKWYRGYPDDRNTDPLNLDNVSYFPMASVKYAQNDGVAEVNRILNHMFYLGDKEQTPVAGQTSTDMKNEKTDEKTNKNAKHSMRR
jgi:hypothetical protein